MEVLDSRDHADDVAIGDSKQHAVTRAVQEGIKLLALDLEVKYTLSNMVEKFPVRLVEEKHLHQF